MNTELDAQRTVYVTNPPRTGKSPLGTVGPERLGTMLHQSLEKAARSMMPLELAMTRVSLKTAGWITDGKRRHGMVKHFRDRRRYLQKKLSR